MTTRKQPHITPQVIRCFSCLVAKDQEEQSIMYWLCFGLWQANFSHPFITGSVIPYIRIEDLKQVITTALFSFYRLSKYSKSLIP